MVDLCAENENWTKSKLHWSMISVGTCTKERKIRRLVKLQKGDAHEKSEVERSPREVVTLGLLTMTSVSTVAQ